MQSAQNNWFQYLKLIFEVEAGISYIKCFINILQHKKHFSWKFPKNSTKKWNMNGSLLFSKRYNDISNHEHIINIWNIW